MYYLLYETIFIYNIISDIIYYIIYVYGKKRSITRHFYFCSESSEQRLMNSSDPLISRGHSTMPAPNSLLSANQGNSSSALRYTIPNHIILLLKLLYVGPPIHSSYHI